MSTTLAFRRMLTDLLHDNQLGPPIIADEARTFDLANRTSSSPPLASSQPKAALTPSAATKPSKASS
jgi:hypothetical protein